MTDTSFLVPEAKRDRTATVYTTGSGAEAGQLTALPKKIGSTTYFSGGGGRFTRQAAEITRDSARCS